MTATSAAATIGDTETAAPQHLAQDDARGQTDPAAPWQVRGSTAELDHHLHLTRAQTNDRAYTGGDYLHLQDGVPHREGDLPARIDPAQGKCRWYRHGALHREGAPAMVYTDGTREWYEDGKLHRTDGGPARTEPSGYLLWAVDGETHRLDGPAETYADGTRWWWSHDNWISENDAAHLETLLAAGDMATLAAVLSLYTIDDSVIDLIAAARAAAS